MEPGIYEGIPYEAYRALDAVSRGDVSPARSWTHSRFHKLSAPTTSEALDLGRVVHTASLQEHLLSQEFFFTEEYSRATKEGKARWERDQQEAGTRTIIRSADWGPMVVALKLHAPFQEIASGQPELTVVWSKIGELCKGRIDSYEPTLGILTDIKTVKDASPRGMQKAIAAYGYHYQLAWYRLGLKCNWKPVNRCQLICVEKEPPYACATYSLDEGTLTRCERILMERLATYSKCRAEDVWPSYPDKAVELSMPGWAFDDTLSEMEAA